MMKVKKLLLPLFLIIFLTGCTESNTIINPTTNTTNIFEEDPIQLQYLDMLNDDLKVIINDEYELTNTLSIDYYNYDIVNGIKMPIPGPNKINAFKSLERVTNYTIEIITNYDIKILSASGGINDRYAPSSGKSVQLTKDGNKYSFIIEPDEQYLIYPRTFLAYKDIILSFEIEYNNYSYYCLIGLNLIDES